MASNAHALLSGLGRYLRRCCVTTVLLPGADHHRRTCVGKRQAHVETQPTAATGDNDHFAVEIEM
jgi:hypothetical protein